MATAAEPARGAGGWVGPGKADDRLSAEVRAAVWAAVWAAPALTDGELDALLATVTAVREHWQHASTRPRPDWQPDST